jgi:hypothetical protein
MKILDTLKKVIHDGLTCIDGITYDPLKVVGYPSAILSIAVYLTAAIVALIKNGVLDYIAYGTGFTALMGGLLAIAAGVAVKSHTEPTQ